MSENITDPDSRSRFAVTRGLIKFLGFLPLCAVTMALGPVLVCLELLACLGDGESPGYVEDQHWPANALDWIGDLFSKIHPSFEDPAIPFCLLFGFIGYIVIPVVLWQ